MFLIELAMPWPFFQHFQPHISRDSTLVRSVRRWRQEDVAGHLPGDSPVAGDAEAGNP